MVNSDIFQRNVKQLMRLHFEVASKQLFALQCAMKALELRALDPLAIERSTPLPSSCLPTVVLSDTEVFIKEYCVDAEGVLRPESLPLLCKRIEIERDPSVMRVIANLLHTCPFRDRPKLKSIAAAISTWCVTATAQHRFSLAVSLLETLEKVVILDQSLLMTEGEEDALITLIRERMRMTLFNFPKSATAVAKGILRRDEDREAIPGGLRILDVLTDKDRTLKARLLAEINALPRNLQTTKQSAKRKREEGPVKTPPDPRPFPVVK